jgi:HK97 family phage prohead protease
MNNRIETKDGLFNGDKGATLNVEMKEVTETGEFEGYASVFNNTDHGGDIVMPGAFKDSLSVCPPEKVRMLFHHDPREVIGKFMEMREDSTGLFVKGRLFQTVQRGKEVHELMKEGAIEGMSIGYRTREFSIDRDAGTRRLEKVDLREVSIVTFPMNDLSGITLVKHDGSLPTEREFERYLTRDAGFTAQQAKAIIADGYKSLNKAARDAGQGSDDAGFSQLLQQATALLRA